MYATAASAAWRYSGKVTGPDSRLSRPTTMGSPVALFSVPSAAPASGVAALCVLDVVFVDDDDSSSPPQPANSAPAAATAAAHAAQFLVTFMVLLIGVFVRRVPRP